MTILLLLILMFVAEYFAAGIILRRLESRHPALLTKLNTPSPSESSVSEKWVAMTRFIYSGACLRVDDVPLNVLCASIVLGEIAILYAIIHALGF